MDEEPQQGQGHGADPRAELLDLIRGAQDSVEDCTASIMGPADGSPYSMSADQMRVLAALDGVQHLLRVAVSIVRDES
ncbi:hypothetical protein [Actinomyces provencensis]|uniref:hypothetical protein n=1 Tax=Actinomyces provencensis TaxID=1720198 RepID=UPI00096AB132|nr:hypothetical protein [Actinomyces provencensis]